MNRFLLTFEFYTALVYGVVLLLFVVALLPLLVFIPAGPVLAVLDAWLKWFDSLLDERRAVDS